MGEPCGKNVCGLNTVSVVIIAWIGGAGAHNDGIFGVGEGAHVIFVLLCVGPVLLCIGKIERCDFCIEGFEGLGERLEGGVPEEVCLEGSESFLEYERADEGVSFIVVKKCFLRKAPPLCHGTVYGAVRFFEDFDVFAVMEGKFFV